VEAAFETHAARRLRERRVALLDAAVALAIILIGVAGASYVFLEGRSVDFSYFTSTPYTFDDPVLRLFVGALAVAFLATLISFVLGLAIGFLTGWERAAGPHRVWARRRGLAGGARARHLASGGLRYGLRRFADFYVELVRGTPLVVQMFFIWEVVLLTAPPSWDIHTRSLVAGVAAMTFNTGGYQSEIFRAGISAVASGQLEAARAVGFHRLGAMSHIVLPQALRLVLPPLTNEFVTLFKASSLLFFIGVVEVTSLAKTLTNIDPKIFELFLLTTALYLLITVPASRASGLLERRYRIPGLGLGPGPRQSPRVGKGSPEN